MKKAIILTVAFAFVFVLAVPATAGGDHDPMEKLKGGLEDIYTVPYDVGKSTYDEGSDANYNPLAFLGGFLKGSFYGAKDIVTGVYDVVTFPVKGHLLE